MIGSKYRSHHHKSIILSLAIALALLLALGAPAFAAGAPWAAGQKAQTAQALSANRAPLPSAHIGEARQAAAVPAVAQPTGQFERALSLLGVQQQGLLLGVYPSGPLQISASELERLNAWMEANGAAKPVVIAGTFMDVEFPNPEWNVSADLEAAWSRGLIPFVNLAAGTADAGPRTAQQIAAGAIDEAIRRWARVYVQWSQGGAKVAFIAPLQEMNADWVSYGLDPENFKLAFRRFQTIFAEEGVAPEAVIWVFAPNGWSPPGHEFEKYYPGDAVVDAVGFSAFNFGACAPGDGWDPFEEAIAPYLRRMQQMAPGKPIFLAQTGTVAEGGDKDAWLVDSFSKLASMEGAAGIVYFNVAKPESGAPYCNPVDWRVYDPSRDSGSQGFLAGVQALAPTAAPTITFSYSLFVPVVNR